MAQSIKDLPVMQEILVQSLGQEALESREGTRASRRVEEGLSRSLSGGGARLGAELELRRSGSSLGPSQ